MMEDRFSDLGKAVEGNEKEELQDLQERLDSKIKVCPPIQHVPYSTCLLVCGPTAPKYIASLT